MTGRAPLGLWCSARCAGLPQEPLAGTCRSRLDLRSHSGAPRSAWSLSVWPSLRVIRAVGGAHFCGAAAYFGSRAFAGRSCSPVS